LTLARRSAAVDNFNSRASTIYMVGSGGKLPRFAPGELHDHQRGNFLSLCFNSFITRNSSGDEIANVNFLYDDIVHVLQNTIDSCINSSTDRRGYVLERMFTKFSKIMQYNGHYAVQGHSRSPILVRIKAHIRLPISD